MIRNGFVTEWNPYGEKRNDRELITVGQPRSGSYLKMGEPTTRSEGGRLPTLDALRGLASLAVMWFHFTKHAMPEIGDGALRLTGKYGWLGVQVFFVISGFVIPYSLQRANYSI